MLGYCNRGGCKTVTPVCGGACCAVVPAAFADGRELRSTTQSLPPGPPPDVLLKAELQRELLVRLLDWFAQGGASSLPEGAAGVSGSGGGGGGGSGGGGGGSGGDALVGSDGDEWVDADAAPHSALEEEGHQE